MPLAWLLTALVACEAPEARAADPCGGLDAAACAAEASARREALGLACDRGAAEACLALAERLEAAPALDPIAAEAYARAACEGGSAEACRRWAGAPEARRAPPDALTLSLVISPEGLRLIGAAEVLRDAGLSPHLPCPAAPCLGPETHDIAGLARALDAIRARHPEARRLLLVPAPETPYAALEALMQVAVGPEGRRFPELELGGGRW
ncbi:MAG: hypothetical protein H6741_18820 [Alphaproteobacteria bacterium]|nr:hypothetical protein [Alphaproteobacteria bacterium]MCB9794763.1 hypothetical protein [Alphaproteobacteria bacterium]